MTGINSAVTGKFSDPPVIMTSITSRFISRPVLMRIGNVFISDHSSSVASDGTQTQSSTDSVVRVLARIAA